MPDAILRISWDFPDGEPAPSSVAVLTRRQGFGSWKRRGTFQGGETKLDDLLVGEEYEIAVAPLDESGGLAPEGAWAVEKATPLGNRQAPPAPTNFSIAQNGELLELEWDDVRKKMREGSFFAYEVRRGSSWAAGVKCTRKSDPFTNWRWSTSGAQTYWVATQDSAGKYSDPVSASITVQPLPQMSDGTELDEDGGGFTGTKTGMEVDSGDLITSAWGEPVNSATEVVNTCTWLAMGKHEVSYQTAETDLGSQRLIRLEADVEHSVERDMAVDLPVNQVHHRVQPARVAEDGTHRDLTDESALIDLRRLTVNGDLNPVDYVVYIRASASSGTGSFVRFVPGFHYCRYVTFRVVVRLWNRWRRIRIGKCRFKERKRNLKDEGQAGVLAAPGPTQILFTAGFIDVPQVVAVSDQAGYVVRLVTATNVGADLRVYDDEGNEAFDGNIHWIAAGT